MLKDSLIKAVFSALFRLVLFNSMKKYCFSASSVSGSNRPGNRFFVYGAAADGVWVAFPSDVKLADLEDLGEPWSAAVKCGQNRETFTMSDLPLEDDPCYPTDPNYPPYSRIFIPACLAGNDISHIELIVDWCP